MRNPAARGASRRPVSGSVDGAVTRVRRLIQIMVALSVIAALTLGVAAAGGAKTKRHARQSGTLITSMTVSAPGVDGTAHALKYWSTSARNRPQSVTGLVFVPSGTAPAGGWPVVSYGRTYQGPWQVSPPGHAGFEPPVVIWIPAIAVSGMTFYTGDKFPKWKGDAFVGSLRTGEIPGTGHLERILFNDKMEELRREALLRDLRQRIRDVRQGPDGLLYVVTDEKEGAVLRIEPAQ